MRGDILAIEAHHRSAAAEIALLVAARLDALRGQRLAIGISGESGSGKSELARALQDVLAVRGVNSIILQQDDYFVLPPRSNDCRRRENIEWVGTLEVDLNRLDQDVRTLLEGATRLEKPLVDYAADCIESETLQASGQLIIAEGTYVSLVPSISLRVFIDRDYTQTLAARRRRNREPFDPFIEQVLEVEHAIIREHKSLADIVVANDYSIRENPTESW